MIDDGSNAALEHLRRAKIHPEMNLIVGKMIQPRPDGVQPALKLKSIAKTCGKIFRRVSMRVCKARQYQTSAGIQSPGFGRSDRSVLSNSRNPSVFHKNVRVSNRDGRVVC